MLHRNLVLIFHFFILFFTLFSFIFPLLLVVYLLSSKIMSSRLYLMFFFYLLCVRGILIPFKKQTVEESYGEVTVSASQSWPHRCLSRYAVSRITQRPCIRCLALSGEYSEVKRGAVISEGFLKESNTSPPCPPPFPRWPCVVV